MAGYLSKTADKVAALVGTAERSGIDPSRVQLVSSYLISLLIPGVGPCTRCRRQGSRKRSHTQEVKLAEAWPNGATGAWLVATCPDYPHVNAIMRAKMHALFFPLTHQQLT